jgi:pimeloyl-ACP methyl ester carboxylesterase
MLAEAGKHSALDLLPEIRVPALVIAGDIDTFTPPDLSRKMAADIPGAELLVVTGGSHTAPLEHPELVGSVLEDFLGRLAPGA